MAATANPSDGAKPYVQRTEGCFEAAIGSHGLSAAAFDGWLKGTAPLIAQLQREYAEKSLPLLNVPDDEADIADAEQALAALTNGAQTLVFFGTGGSSLGGQTLAQLGGWNLPGVADGSKPARPRTRFYDNLDGATLESALSSLDLATTRFVITSKSGGTAETLAQTIAALSAVKAAGLEAAIPKMLLGVTEAAKPGRANGLRALLSHLSIPMLEHHAGVGGRFSCLTNVGVLPAIARGLDVRAVRSGARSAVRALLASTSPAQFAPAVGAATAVALNKEKGVRTLVMMPYADKLQRLAAWFVQLWAESLGKGGEGTTPVAALGPLDQHSQLQLYMDGPREHYLTFLRAPCAGVGPRIDPALARLAGAGMLADRAVGDVVDAQAQAVPEALGRAGRPVRTIDLAKLDEFCLGALLMHFMIETILAGRLLGLNPFDQPAVELAKTLTKERLAKGA